MQFVLNGFRTRIQNVLGEMRLATLPGRALELDGYRVDQSSMVIRDYQVHAGQTSAFQPLEEISPGGLLLAVGEP